MWKDRYKIGVDLIDSQHKELFTRLESFIHIAQKGNDIKKKLKELEITFDFLDEYFEAHFTAEENYQREINYPRYKEHKKEHDDFIKEINQYKDELHTGKMTDEKIKYIAARFLTWLIRHIGESDIDIGNYVNSKE